jgi:hypothetical protein
MKLIERVKAVSEEARKKNIAVYASLLLKGDACGDEDQKILADLALFLRKTPSEVEEDYRALHLLAQSNALLAGAPEREKAFRRKKAEQNEFLSKMEATVRELEAQREKLLKEANGLEQAWYAARRAANIIVDLERKHFELLGIKEPTDPLPPRVA